MSNELNVLNDIDPIVVFKGGIDDILKKIREETLSVVLDVSTEQGRKDIASLAYKVARTKTLLDDTGKKLGEEAKRTVDSINADRKKARDTLDALKEEVRKPLTDFENAEKARIAEREDRIAAIAALTNFDVADPIAETIRERINQAAQLASFNWQEFEARANETSKAVTNRLSEMLDARIKADQEREELERLRLEEEARKKKERDEQIAREAAEKARFEAEQEAAAQRKAAEEKAARERQEAADRERKEREAREAAERREKEAAEKAKRDAQEAAERAEREKQEAIESERKRIEDERRKEEEERLKRESDKKHRAKINNEAKDAIQKVVDETKTGDDAVKAIIVAIASGKIPHVTINY